MTTDPAEPGPFQKYLFSGACYVRVGECYRLLLEAREQGLDADTEAQLVNRLTAVWQDYVLQQNATVADQLEHSGGEENAGAIAAELYRQVAHAGETAMRELVVGLATEHADGNDLSSFFTGWTAACARAYDELVRSEAFARVLGDFVNASLGVSPATPDRQEPE